MDEEKFVSPHRAIPLFWLPLAGQIICMVLPFLLVEWSQGEESYSGPFFSLFLLATFFAVGNIICAVRLGLKRKSAILRHLALWGKVVFSALSTVGAIFFVISVFMTGMLLTMLMGIFSILGSLTVAFWVLAWLYCMGVSVSAYTIAFVWVEVKEKRMKPARAVIHTILQFFIVVDIIDTIIVFFSTRSAKQTSTIQD